MIFERKKYRKLLAWKNESHGSKARQSIKKLVQNGRYDFLETGSLISIHENVKDITISLEERTISMYHMEFEEFCQALDKQ